MQHMQQGARDDPGIEKEPGVLEIEQVIMELASDAVEAGVRSLDNLGQAGQSGQDPETVAISGEDGFELGYDLGAFGAGADQAHLPLQDVDELGQLVQVARAEDSPDRRHPRVASTRPYRPGITLAALMHRPDLVDRDDLAAMPQSA